MCRILKQHHLRKLKSQFFIFQQKIAIISHKLKTKIISDYKIYKINGDKEKKRCYHHKSLHHHYLYVCVLIITILSRSSSIADINLLNCFKLAAITCSSSVCVDPIHSKLNSFKLFANVLWHRDKSVEAREREIIIYFFNACLFLHVICNYEEREKI